MPIEENLNIRGNAVDAKIWLEYFKKELEEIEENKNLTDGGWTKTLGNILENIGEKTKCYVAQKRSRESKDEHSGEYLNTDAMFLDDSYNNLVKDKNEYDPFVLPRVVVELENDPDKDKIAYCLWKLLCIRAPLRVLICYGKGKGKIKELITFLERVVKTGKLMEGEPGELLVIAGDEDQDPLVEWKEYFHSYGWKNDALRSLTDFEWTK